MTISSDDFRDVLRFFASGVTLVTSKAGGKRYGITVSAFSSISTDPPLVAVAVNREHSIHPVLERPGASFAVNILTEDQVDLSTRFASKGDGNRFRTGDWAAAATGAPVLQDALAWLDCTVAARHPAGTHTIYLGTVETSRVVRPEARPLVYWDRDYRRLT